MKSKDNSKELRPTFIVKVGGIPYKVSYLPWKEVDRGKEAARLYGQISYMDHSVHIASDMPKKKQQLALIHEILHAIIQEYNIRELKDNDGVHSEYAIDHLSLGLMDFLTSLGVELPYGN